MIIPNIILPTKVYSTYHCKKRLAVVINLYYVELMQDYYLYINQIPENIDVYIISSDKIVLEKAQTELGRNIVALSKNNRGRDLSAFLVTFKDYINQYDYICFLHDKTKKYEYMTEDIHLWNENLWGNMLGSGDYISHVLKLLDSSQYGLLIPPLPIGEYIDAWYRNTWYANYTNTVKLANKLGIQIEIKESDEQSIGSVFWCKREAIRKIYQYNWTYEDFPLEPMANDGTVSHAIERLFAYAALDEGFDVGYVMTDCYAQKILDISKNKLKIAYGWCWDEYGIKNSYELEALRKEKEEIKALYAQSSMVYIYGAGDFGKHYLKRLKLFGYDIAGFVVSDGHRKADIIGDYSVFELREIIYDSRIGFIIATNVGVQMKIAELLENNGINNYILANYK